MRKLMVAGLAAALTLGALQAQEADDSAVAAALAKDRVAQVAPPEMPRADRIAALHAWVRDEIRPIRTSYG